VRCRGKSCTFFLRLNAKDSEGGTHAFEILVGRNQDRLVFFQQPNIHAAIWCDLA
jgi:hypothetical protein